MDALLVSYFLSDANRYEPLICPILQSVQDLPGLSKFYGLSGLDGQKARLPAPSSVVHAVTLLKNMINSYWTIASDFIFWILILDFGSRQQGKHGPGQNA